MHIYQVDAFTDQAFRGNPAGVCMLDQTRPEAWMQALAAEMNCSETAFVLQQPGGFQLRWFTPKKEVSLCGHASLAAAHILWETGALQPAEKIIFQTLSGPLNITRDGVWIEMDFPAKQVSAAPPNPALNQALGLTSAHTSKSASPKGDLYLLEFESEAAVAALQPDFERLLASGARIAIVTSLSQSTEYDFVSRYFAPAIGINEDPVTGSAHCYLAPYWGSRLNKTNLLGRQLSARQGLVGCNWQGDRVILRGKAVTIFKGELRVKELRK
jgi:PhzF family phenazine biosynthesis protein